jgi:signal transduction histidine kinase
MEDKHILLVEDDTFLLSGVRELLEIEGYQVSIGTDGAEGVSILSSMAKVPDLIISDIRMPNMDGYEFLTSIRSREEWLSIPFIFLTAKGQKEDISYGKLLGVEDYITKPFDFDDLLVSVKSALTRQEQLALVQNMRMNNLKHQILMVLQHEFRTPLSYIVAYSDLLLDTPAFAANPETQQMRDGIVAGSERLTSLIENFLTLAELESGFGKEIYQQRRGLVDDIRFLVPRIMDELSSKAAERGVEMVYQADENLPAMLADSSYLKAAIKQLVDNAIKFSYKDKKAKVHIRATIENEELLVCVTDHGEGILSDQLGLVFDSFYQINRKKHEQQGSGAGLAIALHIAALHNGTITVESEPGEGATFCLRIPVVTTVEGEVVKPM